jgi:carbon-monoxide dehydrogenase medium subunit
MRPAAFEYFAPASIEEAAGLLAEHGPEARVLAGGQSLIPAMNLRVARPSVLIDIGRVAGLDSITIDNGTVTIGARVTHRAIEDSTELAEALPVLPAMALHIGHPSVRNRGTFGGSIANADPASEWPLALLALGGQVKAVSPRGERVIDCGEFFVSYFETRLDADEILTGVSLPALKANQRWSFQEVARQPGAFALVLVLVRATLAADGTVDEVRLAIGGCGARPILPLDDWSFLEGAKPTPDAVEEAASCIEKAIEPFGDSNASAQDRRQMAGALSRRALGEAFGLGGGKG